MGAAIPAGLGVGGLLTVIYLAIPKIVRIVVQVLGVVLISYVGIDSAFGEINEFVAAKFGALPSAVGALIGIGGFGQAINIVLTGYAAALTLKISICGFKKRKIGGDTC
jgi:hypothetical protein